MQSLEINRIKEILTLYDNQLPLPVVDYFIKLYGKNIICKSSINYEILIGKPLKIFFDKRYDIFYSFELIPSNFKEFYIVKLSEMTIYLTKNQEFIFYSDNSEYFNSIATQYPYSFDINWYDDGKEKIINNKTYIGDFKITF